MPGEIILAIGLPTDDSETLEVLIAWLNAGGNVGIHSKPVQYLFYSPELVVV
jgi:hypothetical protein